MSTIVLRSAKGSPLTNAEVDANFTNLNNDKTQLGGTYSSGTANGVLFLSPSKVLTTGSALTFDGNELYIAGASTRAEIRLGSTGYIKGGSNVGDTRILADRFRLYDLAGTQLSYNLASTGEQTWYVGGSEKMRLTITGLGIGTTSPSNLLQTKGSSAAQMGVYRTNSTTGVGVGFEYAQNNASSAETVIAQTFGVLTTNTAGAESGAFTVWTKNAGTLAERMRIDSSGNLGLGVTPSASWFSGSKVFQFGATGSLWTNGSNNSAFSHNAVFSDSSTTYQTTGSASYYRQFNGSHNWFTAPSGTAGNAISFTQAMTLNSSGSLVVGSTTANRASANTGISVEGASTSVLEANINGSRAGYLYSDAAQTIVGEFRSGPLIFRTADTERARIDSSGNLLVGTTTFNSAAGVAGLSMGSTATLGGAGWGIIYGATSTASSYAAYFKNPNGAVGSIITSGSATGYNTSSDYRLKENIRPMTGALAFVRKQRPVKYRWKADGSEGSGYIAHWMQEDGAGQCVTGEKDAVDKDGKPQYQGIDTSFMVGPLNAALNELADIVDAQAALIQTLTARVAALESN